MVCDEVRALKEDGRRSAMGKRESQGGMYYLIYIHTHTRTQSEREALLTHLGSTTLSQTPSPHYPFIIVAMDQFSFPIGRIMIKVGGRHERDKRKMMLAINRGKGKGCLERGW